MTICIDLLPNPIHDIILKEALLLSAITWDNRGYTIELAIFELSKETISRLCVVV